MEYLCRKAKLLFVCFSLCVQSALAFASGAVLVLNSYHQGMDWTDGELAGLRESLDKSRAAELYIEYMDSKRLLDQVHFENIRRLLAYKYRSIKLDAIAVTDNDAFEFMRRYRDELFPGTPVVFTGVNWFRAEQLSGLRGFTGVAETADHSATLALMLRLHPDTERIVAIIDTTTTGRLLQEELMAAFEPLNARVKLEIWNSFSQEELSRKLTELPEKTLVMLMPYAADPRGQFVPYSAIAHLVSTYSPVPVYASWDFYLGYGVIGGSMTSAKDQGLAAGEMLSRILSGETADSIPVRLQTPSRMAFDYRQLVRFGISKSRLPDHSIISHEPWHVTYRWLIWLAALTVVAFLSLAAALWTSIAKRRQADQELRVAAKAFDIQVGMVVTDHNGTILRVNDAFTKTTGYSAEEAVGKNPSMLKSGRHDQSFYQNLWHQLATRHFWQGVVWNRRKNGSVFAEWLTINAVLSPKGTVTQYVGSFSDITHNPDAEAEVHRLAYYDQLTGFPNRDLLRDRLNQAVALSHTSGSRGAFLIINLNDFSTINSTRGYANGDRLLIEAGNRIRRTLRDSDTLARLGGDEFAVVIEDLGSDDESAATKAQAMAISISETLRQPFELAIPGITIGASIGAALFRGGESVEQLLGNCDIALHKAKASGRDALRFFDPEMQAALDQRSSLEQDLRIAVRNKNLALHYQAQTDNAGTIIGAEVLLRWNHPERGLVSPLVFIPIAEETGLIEELGYWVIEKACDQIHLWSTRENASSLRISVNVSAHQFQLDDFALSVERILARTGARPDRLMLELTESVILADLENAMQKMRALKQLGVGFSMDDFGTGYSSLAYLSRLPLDELKIDRSFVARLPGSDNDAVIARMVISMGRSLGLSVLAEGVETPEQMEALRQYGCHAYKGFLIGRPSPVEEFVLLLPSQ
ncbi:MAG: ABC transporter substrate binding protein [Propionivibrio sp.]